jgi:hypothetical protein
VCTNREAEALRFLAEWDSYIARFCEASKCPRFSVFIHEDHPAKQLNPERFSSVKVVHTCQADIPITLGEKAWIIPRQTGAARSFPMYLAWKQGFDYILTMDDDCFPPEKDPGTFFDSHLQAFRMDRWFRTIGGVDPRGIPYGSKGNLPVLLNHGLWTGIPDLDGPTTLLAGRWPISLVLRATREVIAPGMWFPLCAMNVCYSRAAIPAAYNLLMGLDEYGFDRFDDIWSGLFLKRIADHLGFYITSGNPFVRHERASNVFACLRKEALGIQLHEEFWQFIAASQLGSARSVLEAYKQLADVVNRFRSDSQPARDFAAYFRKLALAMLTWAELFE